MIGYYDMIYQMIRIKENTSIFYKKKYNESI